MAYKSYRQTVFNITLALLDEYAKKFCRFFKLSVGWLLIFVALSIVCALFTCDITLSFSIESITKMFFLGSWLLLDAFPDPDITIGIKDSVLWITRGIGFVFSALFAGISVSVFLEPVNTIAFSKYALVDYEKQRLRFRYWIRTVEGRFLHDAQIEVLIMTDVESQNGSTETKYLYRYREPENTPNKNINRYIGIRGVRYCDVDFSQISCFKSEKGTLIVLTNLMDNLLDNIHYYICFRVTGTDKSGRRVYRDNRYDARNILCGYNYLSIRRDEIEKTAKERRTKADAPICPNLKKRNKQLFHEHFNVVYKQQGLDGARFGFSPNSLAMQNKPEDIYFVEDIDCVPSGFRLREFQHNYLAPLKEKLWRLWHDLFRVFKSPGK